MFEAINFELDEEVSGVEKGGSVLAYVKPQYNNKDSKDLKSNTKLDTVKV